MSGLSIVRRSSTSLRSRRRPRSRSSASCRRKACRRADRHRGDAAHAVFTSRGLSPGLLPQNSQPALLRDDDRPEDGQAAGEVRGASQGDRGALNDARPTDGRRASRGGTPAARLLGLDLELLALHGRSVDENLDLVLSGRQTVGLRDVELRHLVALRRDRPLRHATTCPSGRSSAPRVSALGAAPLCGSPRTRCVGLKSLVASVNCSRRRRRAEIPLVTFTCAAVVASEVATPGLGLLTAGDRPSPHRAAMGAAFRLRNDRLLDGLMRGDRASSGMDEIGVLDQVPFASKIPSTLASRLALAIFDRLSPARPVGA